MVFSPTWPRWENDQGLLFFRLLSAFQIACVVVCIKERLQMGSTGLEYFAGLVTDSGEGSTYSQLATGLSTS